MEALREQKGEVVRHERGELVSRRESAVGRPGLLLDALDQCLETLLSFRSRFLDVKEHRLAVRQVELVLEARDLLPGADPSVALPVDPDEDVALLDVSGVEIARSVRTSA